MKNSIFKQKRFLLSVLVTFFAFFAIQSVTAQNTSYVVIINKENTATEANASKRYLRNVFMLNKLSWPDGNRARPVFPEVGQPGYKLLLKSVLKTNDRKLKQHWLQLKQRTGTSQPPHLTSEGAIVTFVGNTPGGVGIVSSSATLPDSVKVLMSVN